MPDEKDLQVLHRKFAVDCFNGTWDLLDKTDRTPEENIDMIHRAHASRYHWGVIGSPLEFARGDWQISRVYAVLENGTEALKYAETSLRHCQQNNIGDFDLAFAYEALARASASLKNDTQCSEFYALAEEAGKNIQEKDDQNYFFSELRSISK